MAANYETRIKLNASYELLADRIHNLPYSGLNMTLNGEIPYYTGGTLFQLKHGMGFTSWGENISIILVAEGPEQTSASIRSECALATQIIDWGKNRKNVEAIIRYLSV